MNSIGLKKYKPLGKFQVLFLTFLMVFMTGNLFSFDFQGRIDTKYDYKKSSTDNYTDSDIYQYHSLDMNFTNNFSFSWFGGLRKDLDGSFNSISGGKEKSDVAFRGLPDAYNEDQKLEYRIYTGYFKYDSKSVGASLGRTLLWDYEFAQFDGFMLWLKPASWLKLEGFAGKPYSYGYYNDYSNYWNESEFIGGGGATISLMKNRFSAAVRYFNLREVTEREIMIGEPSDTFLSNDNYTKLNLTYAIFDMMKIYVSSAMINSKGRNVDATLSGYSESILFGYRLNYYRQFSDIKDFGDRLSQFSYFLTALHPYQKASASFNKSLADIFSLTGPLSDIELEGSYEYQMPVDSKDESRFNPKYRVMRGGVILATNTMCYLNLFYENVTTFTEKNDVQAYGGEISKKWKVLTVKLGSAYYAHKYEATYSTTELKDSFYSREYYFGLKWAPIKSLDLSVKASYEKAEISSLTNTSQINPNITYVPMTEIYSSPRDYMRFEVKLGYIF